MSAVLALAERLRALDDESLSRILRIRSLSLNGVQDFFDLSGLLLQPRNLDAWLATLTRSELESLSNHPVLGFILEEGLAIKPELHKPKTSSGTIPQGLDALAGIHAFEATLVVTELVFELESRMFKDIGKSGIGLADVKRLAALTGKEFDFIRGAFDLAVTSNLVQGVDERWQLTTEAKAWLELETADRWISLSNCLLGLLDANACQEIAVGIAGGERLPEACANTFPLDKLGENSNVARFVRLAEVLGLTVDGFAASWCQALLRGQVAEAKAALESHLPPISGRIIVQADLSVIALGPLATRDERALRLLVETEQSSLASRYRLTQLSISHALECGVSADSIRQTLTKLSGNTLPQPVEYLIADVAKKLGRISVIENPQTGGAFILSAEPALLTELVNDSRLKPYALTRTDSESLSTRFSPEVIYFGLREIGHLAVRVDSKGRVLSPQSFVVPTSTSSSGRNVEAILASLRENDAKLASSEDDAVLRQIAMAIKSKTKLEVVYLGQDEIERTMLLEPIGVANGRLRARDRKADIERTLPIENIISLKLL